MPLTDFVRYLNAQLPLPISALQRASPFVAEGGRVFVHFCGLRLESSFVPVVDVRDGRLCGHAAELKTVRLSDRQAVAGSEAFSMAADSSELVFLDRLVRTLHTLNYLTYGKKSLEGLLLLKVHPRHVASVATDHGLAFEEILRACGLLPQQITLDMEIDQLDDIAHFVLATANYRSRGYKIALAQSGQKEADWNVLDRVLPDFVTVDAARSVFWQGAGAPSSRAYALGCRVLAVGESAPLA